MQSRIDELEDRSRRNNLIFYGLPDAKETWQQTEAKLTEVLNETITSFPAGSFERAHRIGTLSPNKCRPVVAKFLNFKTKEQVFTARKLLKPKNITISEDFSPATRIARKKLTEFAKSQPGSPPFQISYNKLIVNKKRYTYNAITDSIEEIKAIKYPEAHDNVAVTTNDVA